MKKILAILISLMCCCTSVFANPQEAISSFAEIASKVQTEIRKTDTDEYANILFYKYGNSWIKTRYTFMRTSYDVRKTDSLTSPYKGILSIDRFYIRYIDENNPEGMFKTKAEAIDAKNTKFIDEDHIEFIYDYTNGEWIIKEKIHPLPWGEISRTKQWHIKSEDTINIPIRECSNMKYD